MRFPRLTIPRPSALRIALGVSLLVSWLAVIKANYHPPLYGDGVTLSVRSSAERTSGGMGAHERRLASAEILRRAALDPRLAGLNLRLRAGDVNEAIGSVPGPTVYVSVRSVGDGVLVVDSVSEESAAEARAIAVAVADAYVADSGADRVVRLAESVPSACRFLWGPFGDRGGVIRAVCLGLLASGVVVFVPTAWFSRRRLATWLVLAPAALVVLVEEVWSSHFFGSESVDVAAAAVLLSAFGLGAMRRPRGFLAFAVLIWAFAPVMYDGFTAMTLFARAIGAAWVIGACAGWVSRLSSRWRASAPTVASD